MGTISTDQLLPYRVRKPSATNVPTTTYVTDPHLKMNADAAGEMWHYHIVAFITAYHLDDFRFRFSNSDPNAWLVYWLWDAATLATRGQTDAAAESTVLFGADITAGNDVFIIEGSVVAQAAGDIAIEWRKNTDTDAQPDMVVEGNSFIVASRIVNAV